MPSLTSSFVDRMVAADIDKPENAEIAEKPLKKKKKKIKVVDDEDPVFAGENDGKHFYANPHECKAVVELDVPQPEDCSEDITMKYHLVYSDPSHPGKEVALSGEATGDKLHLYLPASQVPYTIHWVASDECWNTYTEEDYFKL